MIGFVIVAFLLVWLLVKCFVLFLRFCGAFVLLLFWPLLRRDSF